MRELPELMLSYGIKLKERGSRYECLCPAHDDHNPSMSVFRNGDGNWKAHCFSCGFHEDSIGMVQYMESCDFQRAKEIIDDPTYKQNGKRYATIEAEKLPPRPMRETYPPPPDAPEPRWNSITLSDGTPLGEPVAIWTFRTPEGGVLYHEARYEVTDESGEIKKEPRCWSWGHRGSMPPRWECAAPNKPRPLYGLDKLSASQILITEGPKTALAAQTLIGNGVACVTWPFGSNGAKYADWSLLADHKSKTVILCPDADVQGILAMHRIADTLLNIGFTAIEFVDTEGMPKGWDIADGIKDGWDRNKLIQWLRERKKPYVKPDPEVLSEAHMPEPPTMPEPPLDAYEELGIHWPTPIDIFSDLSAPHITPEMLPPVIADYAMHAGDVIGCDPAIIAMSSIVVCAAALHDDIKIQPKRNETLWRESARLWLSFIGDSSAAKSPALKMAIRPLGKIDVECAEAGKKIRYQYSLDSKIQAAKEAEYVKKHANGEAGEMPPPKELPEIPRAIAQDCTIEGVREILKHSSRGILSKNDELSKWFGSHDAFKQSKGSDRAAWLEAYNGGAMSVDRATGSLFIKNWSVSVIGGIQKDKMANYYDGETNDGLLQRFMVIFARDSTEGLDIPHNREAYDRYENTVRHIWETTPSYHTITLSPEAQVYREQIVSEARRIMFHKFISEGYNSALGKYAGLSARLMLTYHAIECASRGVHPESVQVSEDTAQRVYLLMMRYLIQHAAVFYMHAGEQNNLGKRIKSVGAYILTRGESSVSRRDIHQNLTAWRNWKDHERDTCMNQLVESGWLAPIDARNYGKSPSHYLVNPKLFELFAAKQQAEIVRRDEWREFYQSMRVQ